MCDIMVVNIELTNEYDFEYWRLLRQIRYNEDDEDFIEDKDDRTGTGVRSQFGADLLFKFDESGKFPLLTLKEINYKAVIAEFVWMVCKGSCDVNELNEMGFKFWDAWKDENGSIGWGYGRQFRKLPYRTPDGKEKIYDQIKEVIKSIKDDPNSRRHIISLWNAPEMQFTTLPCCHGTVIQFYVSQNKYLDMMMYQRSADMFIGVPWNIAFYSLLLHIIADKTGYQPRYFQHTFGDAHVYKNHFDAVDLLLKRDSFESPILDISKTKDKDIDDITVDDIQILNYKHHDKIPVKVAV